MKNNSIANIPIESVPNIHLIWASMMLLTISSYFIGELGAGGLFATLFLLLVAGIKAGLIIRDFMELRGVSFLWRAIMYGWLLVVCSGIGIAYLVGL